MAVSELKIEEFLADGDGDGYGYGYGDGDGDGYGYGDGDGNGDGDGDGNGYGYGYGYGDGNGYGNGYGYGYGYGDGYGDGYGYGDGDGIKSINGNAVYRIDGIGTIIINIKMNIAKGFMVGKGAELKPCYIAKGNGYFAHGETIKEAVQALQDKMTVSEFIKLTKNAYGGEIIKELEESYR